DGHPITMTNFADFPNNMLQEAERCLQVVLQGLSFPDFESVISSCVNSEDASGWIKDDLCNRDPGYSFVSDPRNPFQRFSDSFLQAIMDEVNHPQFAQRFFLRDSD